MVAARTAPYLEMEAAKSGLGLSPRGRTPSPRGSSTPGRQVLTFPSLLLGHRASAGQVVG